MSYDEQKQAVNAARRIRSTAMRITDQFRQKDSMMYDLRDDTVRLTLRVCQQAGGWEIEAIPKQLPGLCSLTATGPSRGDALRMVGEAWRDSIGFPTIDWVAIRDALTSVRAV